MDTADRSTMSIGEVSFSEAASVVLKGRCAAVYRGTIAIWDAWATEKWTQR